MNGNIEDTFRIVGLLEAMVNKATEIEDSAHEDNECGRSQCCCMNNTEIYGDVARKIILYIQKIERILLQNETTNEEIIRMREMRGNTKSALKNKEMEDNETEDDEMKEWMSNHLFYNDNY